MPPAVSPPEHAAVVFMRIAGFDARSVVEQAASKARLEARVHRAVDRLEAADRAVLDADDGIAIVIFGDPARALDVLDSLRDRDGEPLQAGVNHGPLALTSKGAGARVFGDGLAGAAAAARFATPERPLVTDEYRRALEALHPSRAAGFSSAGDFTDTRVRLHSLYADDPARRRRTLVRAAGGVFAILLLGAAGRLAHLALAPVQPAIVSLAIRPQGEVFVDGISRGRAPPLVRVEIAPGRHQLVVRHPGYSPYELALDLKPGEHRAIRHTFAPARAPAKPGFWRDLRRRFFGAP